MTTELTNNPPLELLAPAGDWDALLAALSAGADAVYLGGKAFSARQYASNFDLPQLEKAVELYHLHGRKLYVTVNTLIADSEMTEAVRFVEDLYQIGVDAVIVQDLGLIHRLHELIPEMPLHASTQTTVHNREGAAYLKSFGIRRVVLARELTAAEVTAIAAEPDIEVEVFIHGALCVCYSGQCLMSSMIGGRSGNRGRCAQPCRMEYQLVKGTEVVPAQGQFLLSPKDIALVKMIPDLDRAKVHSLKVEGRMKRPEYVYSVIKVYRQVLDRYYQDRKRFAVEPAELQELEEVFNRGLTSGYFGGNRNRDLMSFARPNNRGIQLGRIQKVDTKLGRITLKLDAPLESGDMVEVWVSQGGRASATVKDLIDRNGKSVAMANTGDQVTLEVGGKINPGDRVFKVFSAKIDTQTRLAIDAGNQSIQVPCSVVVSGREGSPLFISFRDEQGHEGEASSKAPLQIARNRPLTPEVLADQLGRLGNTSFRLTDVESRLALNLMLPLSELNQARREAIERLSAARLAVYRRQPIRVVWPTNPSTVKQKLGKEKPQISVWVADLAGVEQALAAKADLIYAGGDEFTQFVWSEEKLQEAVAKAEARFTPLILATPRIMREGQRPAWTALIERIRNVTPAGVLVSDLGALEWFLRQSELPLYINFTLNLFNHWSIAGFEAQRVKQVCASPELTLEQLLTFQKADFKPNLEVMVHGPMELMVSEYCPIHSVEVNSETCRRVCREAPYYFRDRLNFDFPVLTDQFCRMHLLNSKDLCLIEDLAKLSKLQRSVLRLDLRTYPSAAVGYFIDRYQQRLKEIAAGNPMNVDLDEFIAENKRLTGRGITKGHYFRGVE